MSIPIWILLRLFEIMRNNLFIYLFSQSLSSFHLFFFRIFWGRSFRLIIIVFSVLYWFHSPWNPHLRTAGLWPRGTTAVPSAMQFFPSSVPLWHPARKQRPNQRKISRSPLKRFMPVIWQALWTTSWYGPPSIISDFRLHAFFERWCLDESSLSCLETQVLNRSLVIHSSARRRFSVAHLLCKYRIWFNVIPVWRDRVAGSPLVQWAW